jgi:hypothetical protein
MGFRDEVGRQCGAYCEWTLFRHNDGHFRRSWVGGRLWELWQMVAAVSHGCLLGLSVWHDGHSTFKPMACSHGPLCYIIHCLCEISRTALEKVLGLIVYRAQLWFFMRRCFHDSHGICLM